MTVMDKELQSRLRLIAKDLSGREVSGGVGVDVAVKASSKNGTLMAIVGEMTFRFSDFALVPKDFGEFPYRAFNERTQTRQYFYSADVEWQKDSTQDRRRDIVLGCWKSRKKLHTRMVPYQQAIAHSLLSLVDKVIAGKYGVEFLGPRVAVSREYPEDSTVRVKGF